MVLRNLFEKRAIGYIGYLVRKDRNPDRISIRKSFHLIFTLYVSSLLFHSCTQENQSDSSKLKAESSRLQNLRILQEDQVPSAYFFRDAEQVGRQETTTWEEWYPAFSSLMGIEGKALKEEVTVDDYEQVREYFDKLKELHPDQAEILHLCGRARDPHLDRAPFFAGHWAYYVGAVIENDLSAKDGIIEVKVSDTKLFKINVGPPGRKCNEDVGICRLDENGMPDWGYSEQVKLIDIDHEKSTIKIERGSYGTTPKSFDSGSAYAASHVYEGPQGAASDNMRWYYNYSTQSPRDKNGKQAKDVFVDQIGAWFGEGGLLEKFDGLEFDVLHHMPVATAADGRGMDLNADRKPDDGVFDGLQTYGIGAIEFLKQLRKELGEDRLIMADNDKWFHQRSIGILNGIEHEKFPTGGDEDEFNDWGGGINRLLFWKENSREPVFNYIKSKPSDKRIADIRLAFAAAVICDAGISMTIPGNRTQLGEEVFIWDELRKGQEHELGWLGKGIGTPRRLAIENENLISGIDLNDLITNANCNVEVINGSVRLSKKTESQQYLRFQLEALDIEGQDLFVMANVSAEPMAGYPQETARLMHVEVSGGIQESSNEDFMENMDLTQDGVFDRILENLALIHTKSFNAGFYYRQFDTPATLTFNFEGNEPVTLSDIGIFAAPDVLARKFEKGLVIANPSAHEVKIDIQEIWPGENFRRLKGTPDQALEINTGQPVEGIITIGALDGLFLIRE